MGGFAAGTVVTVRFPFSDLSQSKVRPALLLADVQHGDWIICQITSNPFGDSRAITLDASDFAQGSLPRVSFARPAKLFTANEGLFLSTRGTLQTTALDAVRRRAVEIIVGR